MGRLGKYEKMIDQELVKQMALQIKHSERINEILPDGMTIEAIQKEAEEKAAEVVTEQMPTEPEIVPLREEKAPEILTETAEEKTELNQSSMFDLVNQETEQDKNNLTQEQRQAATEEESEEEEEDGEEEIGIASDAKNALDSMNSMTEVENPIAMKELCKVKAQTRIELIEAIAAVILCLITWDFSKENYSQWKLHPDRKKAIADIMYKLELQKKKKPEPQKDLNYLLGASYAPLIIIAMATMVAKIRKYMERKKAERLAAEQAAQIPFTPAQELPQQPVQQMQPMQPMVKPQEAISEPVKVAQPTTKKAETRGRHAKDCNCEKCVSKYGYHNGTKRVKTKK